MEKQMQKKIVIGFSVVAILLVILYYAAPEWVATSGLSLERRLAGLKPGAAQAEQTDFAYLSGGTSSGEKAPLLLIHGLGGDKDNYTRLSRYLTDHYRVVIPDLPGFGESTRDVTASYGIASQVKRLRAFVESMGLTSFHLAGHSMGGAIAGAYAYAYPDQVRSLLLIAPAGVRSALDSELFEMMKKGENPFIVENMQDFEVLMDLVFYDRPFIPRPVKQLFATTAAQNRPILEKVISDLMADPFNLEHAVAGYPGAVLVIWGEKDRVVHPEGAGILAFGTGGVEMELLENCGHMPILEQPKETAALYRSFLGRVAHAN